MKNLMSLHNEAMDMALLADQKCATEPSEALSLYQKAYEAEKEAAYLAENMGNPEPGLSILFRSAASLAYQCGMLREAERLIAHALSGNPTNEIAIELRDLLQQIYSDDKFADEEQQTEVSFRLNVPKSEAGLFTTIAQKMGWNASAFRSAVRRTAVL